MSESPEIKEDVVETEPEAKENIVEVKKEDDSGNINEDDEKRKRSRKETDEDRHDPKKAKNEEQDHEKRGEKRRDVREKDKKKENDRKRKDRSRSRSRSPKRRADRRDSGKEPRRRESEREKEKEKSRKKSSRKDDEKEVVKKDLEEGEIQETPAPPKQLTARELERKRLIEEEMKDGKFEDDDEPVWSMRKAQEEKKSMNCPYLDTIDRSVLDFDFEKLCSISLSHLNVYACMVCGKYFQGRGTNTHAYTHALDSDHRVFLNLQTLKFYCLPDNYEIFDPSLEDIKYLLKPTYTKEMIKTIPNLTKLARALDDSLYFPGIVGLNNIKANDYCNVILHALSNVAPLRNYFMSEENYSSLQRPPGDKLTMLPKRFGELIRKLWNPRAFRTHVSPHEMLQAVVVCSNKRFQFTKQGDASEFMTFLLNTLHTALNGTQKTNSSIIYKTFRGKMRQYSRKVVPAEDTEFEKARKLALPEYQETSSEIPFLFLTLDLPPAPLYRDIQLQNIIPQVPLHVLLEKFNGSTEKEYKTYKDNIIKRFELLKLPKYLLIAYKRFDKNQWFVEKNPTIVNFPISNVDFYDCLTEDSRADNKYTTYDLVANIVHEGKFEDGNYRIQVMHEGTGKWYELEDLHVKDMLPQMIVLAESYIQVWKLNTEKTREERVNDETAE